MRVSRRLLVILISFAALSSVIGVRDAVAQGTATISGVATDPSQAALPDSQVTLTNVDTGQLRSTTSSGQGYFIFTDLTPGNYKVQVNHSGFQSWTQSSIALTVGRQLTIYPILQVGSASQEVTVTTALPPITTSDSSISQLVDSTNIEQLPLNGRNALQLESLAAGVVSTGTSGQFGATQVTFNSSGGRDIDTNYLLDGGYNEDAFYAIANPYPNPDALQEFAVVSRNYTAKFGGGSTSVTAVTRSGTNSYHGSAYEFLRNTNLDATPLLTPVRPAFHRNQFGGTFGGPIVRNKLFYFVSYEGQLQTGGPGNSSYTSIPIPERTGDFSAISTPVIDPTTGKQFPGNIIPANRITTQATTFLQKFLPAPNIGIQTYSFPNFGTSEEHEGIAKVDYQLTSKDLVFGRYFIDDVPQFGLTTGSGSELDSSWASELPTRFQNITLGEVHTFSPHLLNDFHLSYVRSAFSVIPVNIGFLLSSLGYGVSNGNAVSSYGLTPDSEISIGGAFTAYSGAPTRDIMPTWHISDNVSFVRGKHNIDMGIEIYNHRVNEIQNFFTGGSLTFNGQFSGVASADFLLGDYSNFEQIGALSSRLHQTLPSAYVQDDIKLTHRLVASVGVRWDIVSGYHSEDGQLMSLQPGKQSAVFPLATQGLLFPGDPGIPQDVIGTRWNNIAPRLGLAWDVRGNGQTSLRVGAGTYYVAMTEGITLNRLTLIQPYTVEVNIAGGNAQNIFAGPPYNGVNPFPRPTGNNLAALKLLPFVPTASESSLPTNAKTETAYEWSLSLQQALWKRATLEMDYVGSSSSHLIASADSNPAVYIPGQSTATNIQTRRLYPQIGSVNSILNAFSANYNGLDVVFHQQLLRNVAVTSSYTWSKSMGVNVNEGAGAEGPRDPFNYRLSYSPLTYDVTNNFVSSFFWQPLGAGNFGSGLLNTALGGWQLGGIATLRSGIPLNLQAGLNHSLTGINEDTPDVIGNHNLGHQTRSQKLQHWFNTAAFTQNPIGTFGTLSDNALRNPGYWNLDGVIQKNFKIKERYTLESRASLYNAFNHTNLNAPTASLTSSNFGRILGGTTPRVMEVSLRLAF